MVVFNHGDKILLITEYYTEKEKPAKALRKISIGPGQGIDLDIINLFKDPVGEEDSKLESNPESKK